MVSLPVIFEILFLLDRETTPYLLRNNNNLVTPTTRTEISEKSCIPSSVSLWNSLDNNIRTTDSLFSFKSSIKSQRPNNSKVPPYFLSGDRYLSVQHARVRNNCSNLKSDLYENHLCPRPMCSCNTAVEDAALLFPLSEFRRKSHGFVPSNSSLSPLKHE